MVREKINTREAREQSNGTVRIHLGKTQQIQNDLSGNLVSRSIVSTPYSDTDSFGFPQTVTSTKTQGAETLTTTTTTTYRNDTGLWILGRPDYQTVTHNDQNGQSITREVDYVYEGATLKREIIQPQSPLAKTIEYDYDQAGNAIKVTTAGSGFSRELNKTFDERGRIKRATNALGQHERFQYHPRCGGVEIHTDIAGRQTKTSYDNICRDILIENLNGDSNRTTKEYLAADGKDNDWFYQPNTGGHKNRVAYKIKETSAAGPWTTTYYDTQGRVVRTESLGFSDETIQRVVITRSIFDRYGRKTATTLPYYRDDNGYAVTPSWITIEYDASGRPASETKMGPTGVPVTSNYTYHRLTATQSYADYAKTTVTGIHGKPASITENGLTIAYRYDPMGNLIGTTTAGLTTTVEYDEVGNKKKQIDPSMGEWRYSYNALGELKTQTDAESQTTAFTYDTLGRQKTRTDADGGITTWSYFASGNGIGQLKSEDSPAARKTWAYDTLGRVTSETLDIKEDVTATFVTSFEYDAYSRLITRTEPDGSQKYYDYDNTGKVESVAIDNFKDVDLGAVSTEYQGLLTLIVQKELDIATLLKNADYHYQRAFAYHELELFFLGEKNWLQDPENEEAQALAAIQAAARKHEEMAARYEQMAVDQRTASRVLWDTHRDREFQYKGLDAGTNEYRFEYVACVKTSGWGPFKRCSQYDTRKVKINAAELNPGGLDAGYDASVKHDIASGGRSYTPMHYGGKDEGWVPYTSCRTVRGSGKDDISFECTPVTRTVYQPYKILENTAERWKTLAGTASRIAGELDDDSKTAVKTETGADLTGPVIKGYRQAWVPIAGDITIFIEATVPIIEYETVRYTLQQAIEYYDKKYNDYKILADDAQKDYQAFIDNDGNIIGLAELRGDLSTMQNSAGALRANLEAMGVDFDDIDTAALAQAAKQTSGEIVVWAATMRSADGALQSELFGNGLKSERSINPQTGLTDRITTSSFSGTQLRDIEYHYDNRAQIVRKVDALNEDYRTDEHFGYDPQGRLTNWNYDQTTTSIDGELETVVETASLARNYEYDNRGNMTFKTGAGRMIYDLATNRLESRVDGGSYRYDNNGSMLNGGGRIFTWNAFNKVKEINTANQTVSFQYDGSRNRVVKHNSHETVYYISPQYELVIRKNADGNAVETVHRHQLHNGNDIVATYQKSDLPSGETLSTQRDQIAYYHRDIIGSGELVTGSSMNIIAKRFYTPYGELIQDLLIEDGQMADPATQNLQSGDLYQQEVEFDGTVAEYRAFIEAELRKASGMQLQMDLLLTSNDFHGDLRGYTSHEDIPEVGLINMNARLYDPYIGRFISADTIIPSLSRPLSYNRYAYVEGNPVSSRDPSGHFPWAALAFFVFAHMTDNQALQVISSIYLGAQLGAELTGAGAGAGGSPGLYPGTGFYVASPGLSAVAATGIGIGVVTFLQTGDVGASVKAGFFAALSAGVSQEVGHGGHFTEKQWVQKAAMHGLTQGGIGVLRGDKFVHGFVAGFVSDAAGTGMGKSGTVEGRTLIAVGLSQIAVEAVGGEGNQWALVGALVHLFNAEDFGDGSKANPFGMRTGQSMRIQGDDGNYYWADSAMFQKNAADDYLTKQTGADSITDYKTMSKDEASLVIGVGGAVLATFGTGAVVYVGWATLGANAVYNPTTGNIISAGLGPVGRAMGPLDDFFFPAGGAPLTQTITNIDYLNTATSVLCNIPLDC